MLLRYHAAKKFVKTGARENAAARQAPLSATSSSSGSALDARGAQSTLPVVALPEPGRHPSAMVSRHNAVARALFGAIANGVAFHRSSIDTLRELEAAKTVVYVLNTRSTIDYLYFNVAFLKHNIGLVAFANDIRTWKARPLLQALRSLFRGRRGLPDDLSFFERVVRAGASAMLFVDRPRSLTSQARRFSLPYFLKLLELEPDVRANITLVPLVLIWDKHPDRAQPSLLDEVFGTNQAPGFLRKLVQMGRNAYESFLNLGQPQVLVGTPLSLASYTSEGRAADGEQLLTDLRDTFDRERRIVVGPGVKAARTLRHEILTDPRTQRAISEVALESGQDIATLQKQAGDDLKEIAANFSMQVIKVMASILSVVWNQIYDGLEVDERGLERVREVARESRIVLVPSHKSHVDYLLLSYVFYRQGLTPPHIAAGVNLSFWPLGPLFRRAGAFFLRRSFSGDPLYPRVFNAYLIKLLEEGFFLEFFIEGTRSRTGRLNPPKYGMLNMLVDAFLSGGIERLQFVPVSVGYENIIEGSSYRQELGGAEKRSENIGSLLKTPQVLVSKYGRVYVEFGEPIDTSTFLERYHPDPGLIPKGDELARTVRRLAYRLIHHINAVTTVTPSALAALVVLNNPARGMEESNLAREVGFIVSFLRERQARMSLTLRTALEASAARIHLPSQQTLEEDDFDDFDRDFVDHTALPSADSVVRLTDEAMGHAVLSSLREALALLGKKKMVEVQTVDDERMYVVPEDRRTELSFYRNNIIHYFVPEAVFATALYVVEGTRIDLDAIRSYTHFVSRLFKYEFCFEERRQFEDVFQRTARYFEARGWIERDASDPDLVLVTDPPPAGAEFLRGLLLPNVEAYYLAARSLSDFALEWVDARTLMKRALSRGAAMQVKGELIFSESVAKTSLENAYRVFREWGVTEQRDVTRGRRSIKEVRVTEDYRSTLLEELQEDLKAMIARQKRAPGELLRRI